MLFIYHIIFSKKKLKLRQNFFRKNTKSSVKPKLKTFPVFSKSFQFQNIPSAIFNFQFSTFN
ncbi:MAG TPA: hypothetical protein DDY77_04150 [Clostridiales bacterium]|nr:hypothetical protein [Clostridiales bacterium]